MRGTLIVFGLAFFALFGPLTDHDVSTLDPWSKALIGTASAAMVAGAYALPRTIALGRLFVLIALASFLFVGGPFLAEHPARTLTAGVVVLATLARIFDPRTLLAPIVEREHARNAAIGAAGVWTLATVRTDFDAYALGSVLATGAAAFVIVRNAASEAQRRQPWVTAAGAAGLAAALATTLVPVGLVAPIAGVPALAAVSVYLAGHRAPRTGDGPFDWLINRPVRLMVVSFAGLVAIGTVVLLLPIASAAGPIKGIDAFFTAVSAVCVTGLVVLDTPTDFSRFGQIAIFGLIQVGGLGIMAFSVAAMRLARRRLSVRFERAAAGLLGADRGRSTARAVRMIFLLTAITELGGAALLTGAFLVEGDSLPSALWRGLFTSVSAFCNAGFALQSASLVPYQSNPFVLHVTALIITIGGLGPIAIAAMPDLFRRRRISAHARLVLVTSLALSVGGALTIGAFEWNGALAHLSFGDRIHNAWFQSVTLRTAGFNSIDFGHLQPATLLVMILAMIVGGSPGSTAGGAKTTTIAVLFLAVAATLRGRDEVAVARRRIPHATVYKAAAVLALGLGSAFGALLLLALTQNIATKDLVFESFSAIGTVGLTTGATGALDDVGKLIVAICMFAGRVGPLSLFLWLAGTSKPPTWELPEEDVAVG